MCVKGNESVISVESAIDILTGSCLLTVAVSTPKYLNLSDLDLLKYGFISNVWIVKNNFDANLFNLEWKASKQVFSISVKNDCPHHGTSSVLK